MPVASQRGKSPTRSQGGAGKSSNETPIASKENPNPAPREDGNTSSTRPRAQRKGAASPSTAAGAKQGDHTEATGHDHPSQNEHQPWEKFRNGPLDRRTKKR